MGISSLKVKKKVMTDKSKTPPPMPITPDSVEVIKLAMVRIIKGQMPIVRDKIFPYLKLKFKESFWPVLRVTS